MIGLQAEQTDRQTDRETHGVDILDTRAVRYVQESAGVPEDCDSLRFTCLSRNTPQSSHAAPGVCTLCALSSPRSQSPKEAGKKDHGRDSLAPSRHHGTSFLLPAAPRASRFTASGAIRNMHFKRWRRLRDGAPAPWQVDTNAYKQRFWCHDRPRSEKNGGFGYARGIFHEETMSVYR